MDGFPDLVVTFLLEKKSGNELQSFVLLNHPCEDNLCSNEAINRKQYGINIPRRYFDMHK
jgi:hypothetical protein